jgi:hypothetical protein
MKSIKIFLGAALAVAVIPGIAGAVTILDTLNLVNTVLNALVPIIISLALVMFFWGLVMYIVQLGNEEKRKEAMQLMIWGVIAIFVMVSIWGIIRLLQSTFKVTSSDPIIPKAIQLGRTFQ